MFSGFGNLSAACKDANGGPAMMCAPGDTWKRVGIRQQKALGVFTEGCVLRRFEGLLKSQKKHQREREKGRGRKEVPYAVMQGKYVITNRQKLAGEDKGAQGRWAGLSEKGDFISSSYYITIYPSLGCLK